MRYVLLLTFWSALVMVAVEAVRAAEETPPPNIVLIVSDDHAWMDYGFMGSKVVRTPCLDKLAAQSMVFPRGYVPSSLCCPSLASVITGLYPHQHKITSNDPPRPGGTAPKEFYSSKAFLDGRETMNKHLDAVPTLPKLLAQRGYLSLQTGKWWQGDFKRGGFTHGMTKGGRHGDEGLDIGRKTMQPIYDFIRTAKEERKPFFVWYAPMMPHDPHTPPQRFLDYYRPLTPSLPQARYWGMVEWFDETCGQFMDYLDKEDLARNTIVLYFADNGYIVDPEKGGPMRSKLTPYDGGLRTPILVRWPGVAKPGTYNELAMSIDFVPTILAALGQKPTPEMQGLNLLDAAARQARTRITGACFGHNFTDLDDPARNVLFRWIVDDRWKLIQPAAKAQNARAELYDVVEDPHEKTDRAAEKADVVKTLQEKLDAWWRP